ncbi:MAG: saccharopine dehydrogenase family protein [Panacagrimonas sp.]
MPSKKSYDIVLMGATGFTGQLTAEYLARQKTTGLRWALAGRNPEKLQRVKAGLLEIDPALTELDLLQADSNDPASLRDLAGKTRLVISSVGPYLRYGEALVRACAEQGTDYIDLTGEPEFVDQTWLSCHATALASGARIVHCCGFDSIPHDLGVWFTVQQLPEDTALRVEGFVSAGGQLSGGTWHSAVNAFSRLRSATMVARQRRSKNPFPADRSIGGMRPRIGYRRQINGWTLPFPSIDPQVVRRSAAANTRYGPSFAYAHYIRIKSFKNLLTLISGAGLVALGSQIAPTRRLLLKLRQPGQGPDAKAREQAWFRVQFIGQGGGKSVITEVTGGDPGYDETAKMLAESALCMSKDRLPKKAGCITPAEAMGNRLIKRLQKAGIGFRVVSSS